MKSATITASRRRRGIRAASLAILIAAGLAGCSDDPPQSPLVPLVIEEANIATVALRVGGATQDVTRYNDGTTDWTIYTMAERLAATKIGTVKDAVAEIALPGYIQRVTLVTYEGRPYALASLRGKGIAVVDIADPLAMVHLRTMTVAYAYGPVTYVDGGGNPVVDALFAGTSGSVNDLLVDTMGTPESTDDELFIANGSFGIQKTRLSNLMTATADGALPIDGPQQLTLKYAGENPWGGPQYLKMHGGRLYAALGFLGIAIHDPATLARSGFYNLYTDTATREDWFGYPNRKPSDPGVLNVDPALGLDADGMLTWQEAQFELADKQAVTSYPWAAFDRYGKYYYNARSLDVAVLPGNRTMAYVAYGLGGLVAIDVTDPAAPAYAGYVPAAPAHGPDEPPVQIDNRSILSHFGSGMLKEAGVVGVRVLPDPTDGTRFRVVYTDHFAGTVVVSGAEDPAARWRNGGGNFNNDTNPRVFWPDYEFVTSYDMTPVPVGDESLPKFLTDTGGNYAAPLLLVTGEINGHGGALVLMDSPATMDVAAAGQVDVLQCSGAGGVSFLDIQDLTSPGVAVASRFSVPVNLVSTREIGADENGAAVPDSVAIGHAEGVVVSGRHVFLADGPHGMSAWRITDAAGVPTDDVRLVANTLMNEYPLNGILPTPHAFGIAFGSDRNSAYVMSQSLGMRRVNVAAVTNGSAQVGAPALIAPLASDIYEHSSETGGNVGGVVGQDHAYGVTFHRNYAIVADGGNGLTVYDTTVDPASGNHVVANIGGSASGKPPLGRTQAVKLWTNAADGRIYAVASAGPYGVTVVDMTDLLVNGMRPGMTLIKTFEPIKIEIEDGVEKIGIADGKSVDVHIVAEHAFISYDSFGLIAYRMSDLIRPLASVNPLCTDPTKVFNTQQGLDCRPAAVGRFKLQEQAGYEGVDGGAVFMTPQYFPANRPITEPSGRSYSLDTPRLLFYVAYGDAGVVKLDWSDPAKPQLLAVRDTTGTATATAIANGRVYVADGAGGMVVLK